VTHGSARPERAAIIGLSVFKRRAVAVLDPDALKAVAFEGTGTRRSAPKNCRSAGHRFSIRLAISGLAIWSALKAAIRVWISPCLSNLGRTARHGNGRICEDQGIGLRIGRERGIAPDAFLQGSDELSVGPVFGQLGLLGPRIWMLITRLLPLLPAQWRATARRSSDASGSAISIPYRASMTVRRWWGEEGAGAGRSDLLRLRPGAARWPRLHPIPLCPSSTIPKPGSIGSAS
jgi:hypothetical protein